MKKIRILCLILCLLFLMPSAVSATEADASVSAGCHSVDGQVPLGGTEKIVDTSNAVFVYERTSGTLIYSYNADEIIYPSSMVKMMTALVALENGNLDDVVTVTRSALDSVAIGSVSAGLVRGEEISLRDLLYCMMVASANDASAVIAEYIGGSQENFIRMMNEKAVSIGCTDTNFSNVHGLHDADTYTTVRDICRIVLEGLENESFKAMFEAETYTVPATNKSEERFVVTTNYMMSTEETKRYFDARVTGGKTGATDQAGRCLAVTADVKGMDVVAIVMGAKATYEVEGLVLKTFGSFEEMTQILDFVQQGYEIRELFGAEQALYQYSVAGGSNDAVASAADTVRCVLPVGIEPQELTWNYGQPESGLAAPVAQGDRISCLQVWYGDICVAQSDLVAMTAVEEYREYTQPQGAANAANEEEHGMKIAIVIGWILGICAGVLILMVLVRSVRIAVVKARLRRRRMNRRREQRRKN